MTYFEYLKTIETADQMARFIFDFCDYFCLQGKAENAGDHAKAKEIWQKRCHAEKYKGFNGCRACKIDFLNSEIDFVPTTPPAQTKETPAPTLAQGEAETISIFEILGGENE